MSRAWVVNTGSEPVIEATGPSLAAARTEAVKLLWAQFGTTVTVDPLEAAEAIETLSGESLPARVRLLVHT